jgi:SAM-dependent methyltransferase
MPDYTSIYYPEIAYGGYTHLDSSVSFFLRVRSLLRNESTLLDVGCGRGTIKAEDPVSIRRQLFNFRGACARVIGIDPDPIGQTNVLIEEFRQLTDLLHWPVESESIDVAMADFVMEHVEDVDGFLSEAHRVLKPGGVLCLRTPNVLSYFGLISTLIPNRLHARVASKTQSDRTEIDVFPTRYRCNTRGKLRRALRRHGFDPCILSFEAEPSYFAFSRVLYYLAVLHQRLAPRMFRVGLQAFARKIAAPSG